ncbi:MAG: serine protease, partial [bacterium]
MNLNDIANQLIFTTVPIWTEKNDGKTEIGTGFIFSKIIDDVNSIPLMITNKHVVENTRSGTMALVKGNDGKPNNNERVTINVNGDLLQSNMHESLDIAVFPLGPAL